MKTNNSIPFTYRLEGTDYKGTIKIISRSPLLELDIQTEDFGYDVIVGRHINGNFVCIPNFGVGCELGNLQNIPYNIEKLISKTTMDEFEATPVVYALREFGKLYSDEFETQYVSRKTSDETHNKKDCTIISLQEAS